jgi:hypothetical protein
MQSCAILTTKKVPGNPNTLYIARRKIAEALPLRGRAFDATGSFAFDDF